MKKRFGVLAVVGLFARLAVAGWECPPGQPTSCIDSVNATDAQFQSNINYYKDQLLDADQKIQTCWSDQKETTENKNETLNVLSEQRGKLEELSASQSFVVKLYNLQKNQITTLKLYQNDFQTYFRAVTLALQNDVTSGSLSELKALQDTLNTELTTTQDANQIQVVKMTLSIIDEITSALSSQASASTDLGSQLKAVLGSTTTDLTPVAKSAVETCLTEKDIQKLDINQKLSVIVIIAESMLAELDKKIVEQQSSISGIKSVITTQTANYNTLVSVEQSQLNECTNQEDYLRHTAPTGLAQDQAGLAQNLDYLANDGCRHQYCTYDRPDSPGSGRQGM